MKKFRIFAILLFIFVLQFSLVSCKNKNNGVQENPDDLCEHKWGDLIKQAPTCTESGIIEHTCGICGETKESTVDSLGGHVIVVDQAKAATCTAAGLTEGQHCSRCNEVIVQQNQIPALEHEEVVDPKVEPTCTATGLTEGKHCSRCDETLVSQTTIPATGHDYVAEYTWNEFECSATLTCDTDSSHVVTREMEITSDVTKEATCTETGSKLYTATVEVDGKTYTDTLTESLPVQHSEVVDIAVEPTCANKGLTEGKHCDDCGEVLVAQDEYGELKDHEFVNGECSVCFSTDYYTQGLLFTLNSDNASYSVSKGKLASATEIVIPSYYKGLPVTEIEYKAFSECSSLVTVKLGEKIKYIGQYAFNRCSALSSVTMHNEVEEIGDYAFYVCSSLTSIELSTSLKYINESAFSWTGLTSVTLPEGLTYLGLWAFSGCSSLTNVSVPSTLEILEQAVFSSCDLLQYETYENGLYLGNNENPHLVFVDVVDTTVTEFKVHENTELIADSAMNDCSAVVNLAMPKNLRFIGLYALSNCSALTNLSIPDSINYIDEYSLPSSLNCTVYENGKYLGNAENPYLVFKGVVDKTVTEFTIHADTKIIYSEAFNYCQKLTSISIPNKVVQIGKAAFKDCAALASVEIPSSVKEIGARAFYNCNALNNVTLPNVRVLNDSTFASCIALTNIEIPSSVQKIGWTVFQYCSKLESIVIPNSVRVIKNGAFDGCTSLSSVTFDKNTQLKVIPSGMFQSCDALTSIVIPNTIVEINPGAFTGCDNLASITLPFIGNSTTDIEYTNFGFLFGSASGTTNNSYVPSTLKEVVITGSTSIGGNAFYQCRNITSIVIPASVTSFRDYAFQGCTKLTDIYYTGTEAQWNQISVGSFNSSLSSATVHYNYVIE